MSDLLLNCTHDGVKQLNAEDVRWLYHCSFYDHPLDGVVTWAGKRYWIEYAEWGGQTVGTESRPVGMFIPAAYFLFELSEEQWAVEDLRHSLFCECVGTHCNYVYDDSGARKRGTYRPTGREREFYDAYPPDETSSPNSGKLVAYLDDSYFFESDHPETESA